MHKKLKIIGVGSPIIDHLAHVSDEALSLIAGGKGGMQLVETAVMKKLLKEWCDPVIMAPGGFGRQHRLCPGPPQCACGHLGQGGRRQRRPFLLPCL